jgi:small-conductance mechanosensitive channel
VAGAAHGCGALWSEPRQGWFSLCLQVLKGFEDLLNEHPKVSPGATVRFTEFAASALTIEVMAWFMTTDWDEFQVIRQEIYLQFMQCVLAAGTALALPTQMVHLARTPTK